MQKIILVGKGASGKDYVRKRFEQKGWRYSITCTTRPKRKDEIDGKDYHFVSKQEFKELIKQKKFVEYDEFRGWYYGTPVTEWEKSNLFIMTPRGLKQLEEKNLLKNAFIIYLNTDLETRRKRLYSRGDVDDPERRIFTDEKDFKDFKLFDLEVK